MIYGTSEAYKSRVITSHPNLLDTNSPKCLDFDLSHLGEAIICNVFIYLFLLINKL